MSRAYHRRVDSALIASGCCPRCGQSLPGRQSRRIVPADAVERLMSLEEANAVRIGLMLIDAAYSRAGSRLPGAEQVERSARERSLVDLSDEQLLSLIREGAEHLDILNHQKGTSE